MYDCDMFLLFGVGVFLSQSYALALRLCMMSETMVKEETPHVPLWPEEKEQVEAARALSTAEVEPLVPALMQRVVSE